MNNSRCFIKIIYIKHIDIFIVIEMSCIEIID